MSEISQFHKLARLAKRMDTEVSISSDAIVALSEEIAEAEALAAEMKGELDKLTQELYDSKYIAASRLELLRRWNKHRVEVSHEDCPFCGAEVQVDTTPPPETMILFIDNHANGCELAKELGDE